MKFKLDAAYRDATGQITYRDATGRVSGSFNSANSDIWSPVKK